MEFDLDSSELNSFPAPAIKAIDLNGSEIAVFDLNDDTQATALTDPVYEQFLADVWVGIVLTLMVLSCVCFMCSCLIYHKFQEWKNRAEPHNSANLESGTPEAELPSYTIASGLPTYEEALEQLKQVKSLQQGKPMGDVCAKTNLNAQEPMEYRRPGPTNTPSDGPGNTLSVFNLFGIYNRSAESGSSKPA